MKDKYFQSFTCMKKILISIVVEVHFKLSGGLSRGTFLLQTQDIVSIFGLQFQGKLLPFAENNLHWNDNLSQGVICSS